MFRERTALEQNCLEARVELAAMQVSLQQVRPTVKYQLKPADLPAWQCISSWSLCCGDYLHALPNTTCSKLQLRPRYL
jgi:hypothetical protein